MRVVLIGFWVCLLASCSSLPLPGPRVVAGSQPAAVEVLERAARLQGDPWKNRQRVDVAYEGEWSFIATKLQPVVTDPEFRRCSEETYRPRQRQVEQLHHGPGGSKRVLRKGRDTQVLFNGLRSQDEEVIGAAALVADAYTIFLFGPSWLGANGRDFRLLKERSMDHESCHLVAGRLSPGIGSTAEDHFIVWIGKDSGQMKRFQFSVNGLDSTRGADVDVTFWNYIKAEDGSSWPTRFTEYIQRPILTKAHEWCMTGLTLDGHKIK